MSNEEKLLITNLLNNSSNVSVVTGAGISTSAGIPDFETLDKNWKYEEDRYSIMSYPFFKQDPKRFWEIYKELQEPFNNAKPTAFHKWVSVLESVKNVNVVTQNTDQLHTKSGSSQVIEVHGNSSILVCVDEQVIFSSKFFKNQKTPLCSRCNKVLKPDISLFFEGVQHISTARDMIRFSDLLIVAGTSLQTGPFNEIVLQEILRRKNSLWINITPPPEEYIFTASYIGTADSFALNYVQ